MPVHRAAKSADELALLRGATADLSDPVPMGVYCDFLEDVGDPRGLFLREFLRVFAEGGVPPEIPSEFGRAWADVLGLTLRRRLRQPIDHNDETFGAYLRTNFREGFAEFEPRFAEILRASAPAVRMRRGEAISADAAPIGTSRAGGLPDLPAGMPWPTVSDDSGVWPMQFLFQLDLADLSGTVADGMLPETGLLSVFHYPQHVTPEPRIFLSAEGTTYHRPAVPRPYHWHPDFRGDDEFPTDRTFPLSLSDGLRGGLFAGYEDYDTPVGYLIGPDGVAERFETHWLCTTFKPGVDRDRETHFRLGADHLKLVELDGCDDLEWAYFDSTGSLHVFIPVEDARAGRLDRVQSYEI